MEKTLRELAEYLQGTLENEDQKLIVTGVNGLVEAGPQDISFAVPPHVEHCHLPFCRGGKLQYRQAFRLYLQI